MLLVEFRQRPDLVEQAQEVFRMPIMQTILQMLQEEHPHHNHGIPVKTGDDALTEMGRIRGYDNALANMEATQLPITPPQTKYIETTWGVEPKSDEQEE